MQVLIYDGECSMCSSLIQKVVKSCQNDALRITDFHSTWTQEHVELDESVDSMYYIKHGRTYVYSAAVIRAIADTRRAFRPILLLLVIPPFIRNPVYRFVAKHRKKIGITKACPLPTQNFKQMYLP
ncbi:thiol-disulfide oxidoreductase DCC family protein [Paenibacillus sp.]|jgi:predicted DCC family thiol-disulfide oxidoreductase YuxK|uniref:thiol-disulfide oxidoreductase DCC family protein n=1 Tax=Paenibacillus sp. TaxID=58172 RepID=UPI0028191B3B|nr:DCC1-like thiol-disulfide oxidoreductase family protein [Paenibacillus sp.]